MVCIPYVSVPMKDGVFANDGEVNGFAFAGADDTHNHKYNVHNRADAADNPAEHRNDGNNRADDNKNVKHEHLVEMVTQEFGVRFRKKTKNAEKEAEIAKRREIFGALDILGINFSGVVGGVYISSLLLIGRSGGCYRSTAVGAEVFSVRNVGAASGTKCH